MTLTPPPIGDALPLNPTYAVDELARRFWQASFRCARGYLGGPDAVGVSVLVQHEREEATGYARRLRTTKARNFVGPILRRYNALVFRKPPIRDATASPLFATIEADATGEGETLDAFMSRALLRAQIDRESWIMLGVEGGIESDAPTVAQMEAAGTRPTVELVTASSVINWVDEGSGGSVVCEAWVLMEVNGVCVCRMFTKLTYTDAILKPEEYARGSFVVASYTPPVAHGYAGVPLVRLRPHFDPLGDVRNSYGDSQAGPLAESQQAIVNLLSLVTEEIYNVTFSQMIAFGVSDAQVGDARVGSNRVMCVPNPAGSVTMIGADPAQATSIRTQVLDEVDNLFRLAGVTQGDASTPASGVSLAFRYNDLATIVASLAIACEQAEAAAWALLAEAWGVPAPGPVGYQGKDTELPDFTGEAASMLSVVANAALPPILRQKVAERFAARNLTLTDDEKATLAEQIVASGALARTMGAGSTGAFPPRAPAADGGDGGGNPQGGNPEGDRADASLVPGLDA